MCSVTTKQRILSFRRPYIYYITSAVGIISLVTAVLTCSSHMLYYPARSVSTGATAVLWLRHPIRSLNTFVPGIVLAIVGC